MGRTTTLMSYLGLGFVMSVFIQYSADAASAQTIPAKLICGAHSSNPEKLREFQANVVFTLSGGNLIGKRALTSNGGGEETFKGTVSPAGAILVSGEGHYKRGGAWVYELTGIRNDAGDTTLSGKLTNTSGSIGERTCQIIFLKPRTL